MVCFNYTTYYLNSACQWQGTTKTTFHGGRTILLGFSTPESVWNPGPAFLGCRSEWWFLANATYLNSVCGLHGKTETTFQGGRTILLGFSMPESVSNPGPAFLVCWETQMIFAKRDRLPINASLWIKWFDQNSISFNRSPGLCHKFGSTGCCHVTLRSSDFMAGSFFFLWSLQTRAFDSLQFRYNFPYDSTFLGNIIAMKTLPKKKKYQIYFFTNFDER